MKRPHIVVIVVFTVIFFSWILFAAVRSLSSSFSVHKRISPQECAQIAQELALPLLPSAFLAERVPKYLNETSYASVSSLQKHLNAEKSSVIGYFLDFSPPRSASYSEEEYFSSVSVSVISSTSSPSSETQRAERPASIHDEYTISQHGLQVQYMEIGGVPDDFGAFNNPSLIYTFSSDTYRCDMTFAVNGLLTAKVRSAATEIALGFLRELQDADAVS